MAKKKAPLIVREIQETTPQEVNFAYEKNISYSQLSMYTQCPRKWALQYRDGHKVVEQSIHMTFGTALHETLQMYTLTNCNRINILFKYNNHIISLLYVINEVII